MWKAIWFGLAGIPLGFAIGGELAGAVAATVIVSIAGAMSWGEHHMCESRSRGVSPRAFTAVAGVAVVIVVAHAVLPLLLPLLLPAVAVLAVLAVVSVPVMRLAARRLTVPRWSAAYTPPAKRRHPSRPPRMRARPQTALPAGTRLAITDGRERALEGVVLDTAIKEARRG